MGSQKLAGTVQTGENVGAPLGQVRLEPGSFEIQVVPEQMKGQELVRLRCLVLRPATAGSGG